MYALGATLYHMGTGRAPFEGLEPEDVAAQQVHGQIPGPREVNPTLSYGFCALVERLMAKDQQFRYETWEGVLSDLMEVRSGNMVKEPPSGTNRSTVEHTPIPANAQNSKSGRKRGESPVRQVHIDHAMSHPQLTKVNINADALSRTRAKLTQQAGPNLWPIVVLLLAMTAALYSYTLFF
jgi:serine/threonine protein kinase